ncbi:hypothetical protein KIW84_061450 [Lathyrus oleraceus]|uniref:Pentatricopeptide repeat-containing protein n=1 Tax=Pisum sativum TaxID=3888 RepID=A0A9D4W4K7_PEA|nr:hypothetical protein KIW84_061450 [Pisum sativum]
MISDLYRRFSIKIQSPPDLVFPSEPQFNSHKRSRSDPSSDLDLDSADVEKREKVRVRAEDPPADEDWLRYSPPPSPVRAEEVIFSKEKTLSRFASEIDGEVMPVTAPNGDRVYTKLDRYYGEDRTTKLNSGDFSSDLALEPISVLFERLEEETFAKTLEVSSESQRVVDVPETLTLHEKTLVRSLWVQVFQGQREDTIDRFWKVVAEMRSAGFEMEVETFVKVLGRFCKRRMIKDVVELYEFALAGANKPTPTCFTFLLIKVVSSKELDMDLFSRVLKVSSKLIIQNRNLDLFDTFTQFDESNLFFNF